MATLCKFTRSRNLAHYLKRQVGRLPILTHTSWINSSQLESSAIPLGDTAFRLTRPSCFSSNSTTIFSIPRFKSTEAQKQVYDSDDQNQALDFPGGKVTFTSEMQFISESSEKRVPCYRVLDDEGQPIMGSSFKQVSKEVAVKMYEDMVTLQIMDTIFYEAQRQGRISFYLTSLGEEAINIASAAALTADDVVLPQGDFHAGLNFAAVMEAPVIFFCRNNGWAISTPVSEQFRSDGVVVKGQAYGIRSIRVDGNDALAVYSAVRVAREMAISEQRPILVEALTFRVGHHSTSDDSTKYRPIDEIEFWKMARNPVNRFRKWVERNGWWSEKDESEHRSDIKKQLIQAIRFAEKMEKPSLSDLFTDVYELPPSSLIEQERLLGETIKRYPQDYPSDVPL